MIISLPSLNIEINKCYFNMEFSFFTNLITLLDFGTLKITKSVFSMNYFVFSGFKFNEQASILKLDLYSETLNTLKLTFTNNFVTHLQGMKGTVLRIGVIGILQKLIIQFARNIFDMINSLDRGGFIYLNDENQDKYDINISFCFFKNLEKTQGNFISIGQPKAKFLKNLQIMIPKLKNKFEQLQVSFIC